MLESLNQFLADLVVEYHKLQNFHWYVAGMDFFCCTLQAGRILHIYWCGY